MPKRRLTPSCGDDGSERLCDDRDTPGRRIEFDLCNVALPDANGAIDFVKRCRLGVFDDVGDCAVMFNAVAGDAGANGGDSGAS